MKTLKRLFGDAGLAEIVLVLLLVLLVVLWGVTISRPETFSFLQKNISDATLGELFGVIVLASTAAGIITRS
ncbi:MAG: hypothetical protein HN413_08185 [Chloroflexi bacterium]|nr:hypothetical protein [Chloroflexota bacterium]